MLHFGYTHTRRQTNRQTVALMMFIRHDDNVDDDDVDYNDSFKESEFSESSPSSR